MPSPLYKVKGRALSFQIFEKKGRGDLDFSYKNGGVSKIAGVVLKGGGGGGITCFHTN